ncbi:hypothetical protein VNO77_02542 [Canavalia gladiata]|uniref:Uncharacterized protein n=1 Tax=Canavalia gladiata TaxID=3824 RepID=A0AAN9MTE8_CANGL
MLRFRGKVPPKKKKRSVPLQISEGVKEYRIFSLSLPHTLLLETLRMPLPIVFMLIKTTNREHVHRHQLSMKPHEYTEHWHSPYFIADCMTTGVSLLIHVVMAKEGRNCGGVFYAKYTANAILASSNELNISHEDGKRIKTIALNNGNRG